MGYIRTCDLCGRPLIESESHRYKIKREWHLWWESGWENIECHDECVRKLLNGVEEHKKEGEENRQ